MMNRILVTIVNHNNEVTAEQLLNLFSKDFDTKILDSGSVIKPKEAMRFDNIYYGGLFNESVNLALTNEYDWLVLITSDILIDHENYNNLKNKLLTIVNDEFIGLYSPSSVGGGHWFGNRLTKSKIRPVPFVEGFFFMMRVSLLTEIFPVDLNINKIGWGIDTLQGYICWKNGFGAFIDDSILIKHPITLKYSHSEANKQMFNLFKLFGKDFELFNRRQGLYILLRYFSLSSLHFIYLSYKNRFIRIISKLRD